MKKLTARWLAGKPILKFFSVGFSGIFVNSAFLAFAVEWIGLHYLLGAVFATQASTLWNFYWTERWVFDAGKNSRPGWLRVLGFFVMNNVFLLFRAPLIALFTDGLGLNYLISNLASIFILAIGRFMISRSWIWQKETDNQGIMKNFYYNIHGLGRVSSTSSLPELAYFQVENLDEPPDIQVVNSKKKDVPEHPDPIIYDEGFGNLGFWIVIHPGTPTKVYVSPLLKYSRHVLYTNVVEPLLRWHFVRKGYALVHGACLSYQKEGLLVTAGTDTGKTTTILKSLDNYPFDFVSDDMVIMGRDGSLRAYPKPLTISLHTLRAVKKANLTFTERFKLQFQSRLHSRLGRQIGMFFGNIRLPAATLNAYVQMLVPPPKFMIDRLVPSARLEKLTHLRYLVVIERGAIKEEVLPAGKIAKILSSNIEDAYGFPPYPVLADKLKHENGKDLKPEEDAVILSAISNLPAVYLRRSDFQWWTRLPAVFYGDLFGVERSLSAKYPTVPRPQTFDS